MLMQFTCNGCGQRFEPTAEAIEATKAMMTAKGLPFGPNDLFVAYNLRKECLDCTVTAFAS